MKKENCQECVRFQLIFGDLKMMCVDCGNMIENESHHSYFPKDNQLIWIST